VAVTDVDEAGTSAAAEQLGERAWPLVLDVTDTDAVNAAADQVVERSGSLDVWVNNAGILLTGLAYEQPIAAHRQMLEVNAVGTMNGTLAAIEKMRPSGRGHIINLISLAGLAAATGIVGYSASKHAAIAFSLGMAADLRRGGLEGIHISCVCPDGVWTPMINDKLDDPNDALSFSGVMLMPEQVAERAVELIDKPKPVLTMPAWRGQFARFFDRHPKLSLRLTPFLMRDALRRQRAFKKKVESGKWPPKSP
jgi:short-subunit dehydrogenase